MNRATGNCQTGLWPAVSTVFLSIVILISGCAAPLTLTYKPVSKSKGISAVTFVINDFADARDSVHADDPRLIGRLDATITDMTGDRITLDSDVASVVTTAFREEFSAAGYTVKAGGKDAAGDFVLSGKVTAFALDIGARDEIEITVEAAVTEQETGRVIWSGVKTEKAGRFAGVMGNSRDTISRYISASLAKVVTSVIDETAPLIENTRAAYRPVDAPHVSAAPVEGSGRLVVASNPARAKVYLNDIYYGLTPLNIDIEPGVYELRVKSRSYRDASEKVSVRAGQLTEVEMEMDAE
ncbi:MAG: PEGA domain-containing protein [Deltaproteobacteria bacterium]|nr:PEGA domain-containing protein [Deltaproteobacteria bacterium]